MAAPLLSWATPAEAINRDATPAITFVFEKKAAKGKRTLTQKNERAPVARRSRTVWIRI